MRDFFTDDEKATMDPRIVNGVNGCTWWDSIHKVGRTRSGLPGCPRCGSPLLETPSIEEWWRQVDAYEATGHPGYRRFIEWLRGKCFPSLDAAWSKYRGMGSRPVRAG